MNHGRNLGIAKITKKSADEKACGSKKECDTKVKLLENASAIAWELYSVYDDELETFKSVSFKLHLRSDSNLSHRMLRGNSFLLNISELSELKSIFLYLVPFVI
jgi:hypothetical protein